MSSWLIVIIIEQLIILITFTQSISWKNVSDILNDGITSNIYPGYTSIVGYRNGTILFESSNGSFVYKTGDKPPPFDNGTNPLMTMDTHFDMASITKLLSTTSSILKLIENKKYINSLYDPITKYLGPTFAVNNKSSIKIINCLLHNAGFYPDPVPNWFNTPQFGCPISNQYIPPLTFNCTQKIYNDTIYQPLDYDTGTKMIYSDISMMTLSFVIGEIVKSNNIISKTDLLSQCFNYGNIDAPLICYFEAFVRIHIFGENGLNMSNTNFVPSINGISQAKCAPTCNSTTTFNHEILQGIVQDPNSFANGGVFGHAGVFSNVYDLYKWSMNIMNSAYNAIPIFNYTYPYLLDDDVDDVNDDIDDDNIIDDNLFFDPQWINLFLTEYNHSLSSRALGFDTNDFYINDYGGSHVCGTLENGAFDTVSMHTGFTGTLFCLDRERDLIYLLLTNRVYPNPYASSSNIVAKRRQFSNAVLNVIDSDIFYPISKLKYITLYKQCNSSWRNDIMINDKFTLCNSWSTSSFITNIAMILNTNDIKISSNNKVEKIITPSTLNQWIIEQNGYNQDNELIDKSLFVNIDKTKISYIGSFDDLSLEQFKIYLNSGSIIISNCIRHIDQKQYKYKQNIERYVIITGYSLQDNDTLIGRDPFLSQMRFSYSNELVGDYSVYTIL